MTSPKVSEQEKIQDRRGYRKGRESRMDEKKADCKEGNDTEKSNRD